MSVKVSIRPSSAPSNWSDVLRCMPKIVFGIFTVLVLPSPQYCHAQTETQVKQIRTEEILLGIAQLKMPDVFKAESVIEELRAQFILLKEQTNYWEQIDSLRMQMRAELDAQTRVRLDEEMRMEEEAVKETGIPTMSRDSIELLIRNCLVELQRIDWDVASEAALASEPSDNGKNAVIQARLEGQAAQVASLEKQLVFAMKNLEQLKSAFDRGLAPVREMNTESAAVEGIKAKLVEAEANMRVLKAEMEKQDTESALSSALRLKQLEARKKVISSQLEKLALHKRLMANVEREAAKKKIVQQQLESLGNSMVLSELQLTEMNALLGILRAAIDGAESIK